MAKPHASSHMTGLGYANIDLNLTSTFEQIFPKTATNLYAHMERNIFHQEPAFVHSLTFNKWVPLMCADIASLHTFAQIYSRPPEPSACITSPQHGPSATLLHPPLFFRNHPINYVSVTGRLVGLAQSHVGASQSLFASFTLDDASGTPLKCVLSSPHASPSLIPLENKVLQAQGFLIDSPAFGRQLRVVQFFPVNGLSAELDSWCEILRVRQSILTKHWDYTETSQTNYPPEPLPQPAHALPTLFCSFHRESSLLVQDPDALVITNSGGVQLSNKYTNPLPAPDPRLQSPSSPTLYNHNRVLKSSKKACLQSSFENPSVSAPTPFQEIPFTRQNTRQDPPCAPDFAQRVYLTSQVYFFPQSSLIPPVIHSNHQDPPRRRHLQVDK